MCGEVWGAGMVGEAVGVVGGVMWGAGAGLVVLMCGWVGG
jgi:hypothetical protein